MVKRSFSVRALWDDEAKVYYSDSDIVGLHIEAATLDEFEAVLMDLAPSLVVANHMLESDIGSTPIAELIPAILWQRPLPAAQ